LSLTVEIIIVNLPTPIKKAEFILAARLESEFVFDTGFSAAAHLFQNL